MNDLQPRDPATPVLHTASTALPPVAVYLASLRSPHSRRAMLQRLQHVAFLLTGDASAVEHLPWHELRHAHTVALRAELDRRPGGEARDSRAARPRLNQRGASPKAFHAKRSINLTLAAVRGILQTCRRLDLMPADACQHAIDGLRTLRVTDQTAAGRALSQAELNRLLAACTRDQRPIGARDAAIVVVMALLGLRRSEVVALDYADVTAEEDGLLRLDVAGKGDKPRTAYLGGSGARALRDWLQRRGAAPGPLFVRLARGGLPQPTRRLSSQSIYVMLKSRALDAGVRAFTPHDLRRTCISNHLDAGTDIATLAAMVGHSSVETTRRYDRRGEAAKRAIADVLDVAYSRSEPQ